MPIAAVRQKPSKIIDPMLQVNPRLINTLVLKVECHLALQAGRAGQEGAGAVAMESGQGRSDFPARAKAEELALKVSALAVGD